METQLEAVTVCGQLQTDLLPSVVSLVCRVGEHTERCSSHLVVEDIRRLIFFRSIDFVQEKSCIEAFARIADLRYEIAAACSDDTFRVDARRNPSIFKMHKALDDAVDYKAIRLDRIKGLRSAEEFSAVNYDTAPIPALRLEFKALEFMGISKIPLSYLKLMLCQKVDFLVSKLTKFSLSSSKVIPQMAVCLDFHGVTFSALHSPELHSFLSVVSEVLRAYGRLYVKAVIITNIQSAKECVWRPLSVLCFCNQPNGEFGCLQCRIIFCDDHHELAMHMDNHKHGIRHQLHRKHHATACPKGEISKAVHALYFTRTPDLTTTTGKKDDFWHDALLIESKIRGQSTNPDEKSSNAKRSALCESCVSGKESGIERHAWIREFVDSVQCEGERIIGVERLSEQVVESLLAATNRATFEERLDSSMRKAVRSMTCGFDMDTEALCTNNRWFPTNPQQSAHTRPSYSPAKNVRCCLWEN